MRKFMIFAIIISITLLAEMAQAQEDLLDYQVFDIPAGEIALGSMDAHAMIYINGVSHFYSNYNIELLSPAGDLENVELRITLDGSSFKLTSQGDGYYINDSTVALPLWGSYSIGPDYYGNPPTMQLATWGGENHIAIYLSRKIVGSWGVAHSPFGAHYFPDRNSWTGWSSYVFTYQQQTGPEEPCWYANFSIDIRNGLPNLSLFVGIQLDKWDHSSVGIFNWRLY